MRPFRVPKTLLASLLCLPQAAPADTELAVHANEARAQILPRDGAQRHTRLPSLQFSIRADFACPDDAVAESVTISVADVFRRYVPKHGDETLEAEITVPGNQIAAIAMGEFCLTGDTAEELLVGGVATAQVSLRCTDAAGPAITFASLRLPLRLECRSDGGQDPSAELPSPAR